MEIDLLQKAYCSVPIQPVTVLIRSVTVPIPSVAVHLAKRGFQHCVVYCLLPLTLVYFAVKCYATRAVLSVLSHTLYNHKDHLQ